MCDAHPARQQKDFNQVHSEEDKPNLEEGRQMSWNLGDTIWVEAIMTDKDGTALTPDSQIATLEDPAGTTRATDAAPTLIGTGVYEARLPIPATGAFGVWTVEWVVIAGVDQETESFKLQVESL